MILSNFDATPISRFTPCLRFTVRSAHGIALDVASRESYTSFLETVKREVEPIDVNLCGVMLGCHLVLPDM